MGLSGSRRRGMLNVIYQVSFLGDRTENLDRAGHIQGSNWSLSYILDGFEIISPHYVDCLVSEINKLSNITHNLTLNELLEKLALSISTTSISHGKASAVFVASAEDQTSILYAGDTRAYFLNSKKRTIDDSLAQRMIDEGKSKPETLSHHPFRRYLTNKLYHGSDFSSLKRVDLHINEEIVLCSDGIWSCIDCDDDFYELAMLGGEHIYNKTLENRKFNRDNMTIMHLKP